MCARDRDCDVVVVGGRGKEEGRRKWVHRCPSLVEVEAPGIVGLIGWTSIRRTEPSFQLLLMFKTLKILVLGMSV